MIRVLLADDHELVRTGIKHILSAEPDIEVVAEVNRGEDALRYVRESEVDVILMDLNMPGIGGIEATRRLSQSKPKIRIIVLTVFSDKPYPNQLFEAGARGYLTKGSNADELVAAIRAVFKGERYVSAEVAQRMVVSALPGGDGSPLEQLSARELQVLQMIAEGRGIQDISAQLCLSPKTVSTYRHRVFEKLGVANDVEMTRLALRYGIISELPA